MTKKEMEQIADMVADRIAAMQERNRKPVTLTQAAELYGWSKSYLYKNALRLGAVKAGGRLFFFTHNIDALIRAGAI